MACREVVTAFMRYVAVERQLSASAQNQALDAITYFCREVLRKPLPEEGGVWRARRGSPMALVLSEGEVSRLLEAMQVSPRSGKLHLMAVLCYGAGAAGAQRSEYDHDLHPCAQSARNNGTESD